MEVSARIRATAASPAPRLGRRTLPARFASVRPAARAVSAKIRAGAIYDLQRNKSNLELLFCYDKSVPEEDIGTPVGLDLEKKNVGGNPPCISCETKGAVLCATCGGSGLYIDSILESQGIIVKVRCLGCGGTGNIMCSKQDKLQEETPAGAEFRLKCTLESDDSRTFTLSIWFKREEIRVQVDNHGHLRTRGERLVAGNRWSKFQKDFQLPANCNVDGIRAKFENNTLTITLPKKSPSPVQPPAPAPMRAASLRPPQALPELSKPPPPPKAPAPPPTFQPAPSKRSAESRPSLNRKPSGSELAASTPAPPAVPAQPPVPAPPPVLAQPPVPAPPPVSRNKSNLDGLLKPTDQDKVEEAKKPLPAPANKDEEEKQMDREARGKMQEDKRMAEEKVDGRMGMEHRRRPVSASRGLLVNVAVAVAVLLGITFYVWHTLRSAATGGGAGDHGHGGDLVAASYSDEM
ncbi:hypothetical protein ABZP36_019212 [Zizania latifolia]